MKSLKSTATTVLKHLLTIVDAFVALGGEPDRSGLVKRQTIINIIKEFELTIEIEDYLETVGAHSDTLTFDEFCLLFETPTEDSKLYTTMNSFLSVLTANNHRL